MPFDGVKPQDLGRLDLGQAVPLAAPAVSVETVPARISVTSREIAPPPRRGRPVKTDALSAADRQQRHREKKTRSVALAARALFKAKDEGDWEAVERIARALMQA